VDTYEGVSYQSGMGRTSLAIVLLLLGCTGRVSEPSGMTDPVGTVTIALRNDTSGDVFVRWQDGEPVYALNWEGKHLDTTTRCSVPCEQGCACVDCAPPARQVRRLPAGSSLSFVWTGSWYEAVNCGSGCACDETRSALPGSYRFTVAGARAFQASGSGTPVETQGVVSPAELDLSKGACEAQVTAKLVAGAQPLTLVLTCDGSP
jgi:hypothetical protein